MNLAHPRNSIEVAAKHVATLVVLPEMWNCPYSIDYFEKFARILIIRTAPHHFLCCREVALGNRITIVGGSMQKRRKNGRLYNTAVFWTRWKPKGQA
ncbi:hypothetical protein LOK49_LG02G01762 [Camellia lanceoleosa]|uniref:Uncharacterized protein n=1 Tax=Camellia lanceoleosa TaxID=1840588 RepID=A0ACC0IIA7_9ERIC|nr:hypothetical protein LOK49_LG02G01762 [Camellia lanceoleosa]